MSAYLFTKHTPAERGFFCGPSHACQRIPSEIAPRRCRSITMRPRFLLRESL